MRVLLTGASAGIGAELAAQLAARGDRLVISARRKEKLDAVARRTGALAVVSDQADEAACRALVAEALQRLGGLDMLLINAGISMNARFEELQGLRVVREIFETNFFGAVALTQAALPALLESRGRIVVVSSLAAKNALPTRTAYAASKHALHGFFDSLRAEVEPRGVRVTLACPGAVTSEIRARTASEGRGTTAREPKELEMTASECARRILRAADKGKREELMTLPGKLGPWVRLIAPGLIDRIVRRKLGL